jgi:hypothetical protein
VSNPIERIEQLLLEAEQIALDELGETNIFYNERFIELFIANKLGHTSHAGTQGSDASDEEGPTEYKAINTRSKSGKGTFQFHWLSDKKINKYKETTNMYLAIRDGITIRQITKIKTDKILPLLCKNSTGSKSINGHLGFNQDKVINLLGGKVVYEE